MDREDTSFFVLLSFLLPDRCALLLLMDDQPRPRFFLVPLEPRQDRFFQFIVGLFRALLCFHSSSNFDHLRLHDAKVP